MINIHQVSTLFSKSLEKSKQNSPFKQVTTTNKRKLPNSLSEQFTLPPEEFLSVLNLKKAENILPFKLYAKKQNKDRFKHRLNISIHEKYKIKSTEFEKRLHVEEPISDIIAVTDVDENFYGCVDGRPIHLHIPVFKSLKESINKLVHIKEETGIKKDCFLNVDTNCRNEMDVFDLAVKRLTDQVKSFDIFISEDYQKSMSYLTKCDKLRNQVDLQVQELQNVAIEKFTIISKLIGLEYKYGLQQKYGRFLYYLSPPSWRLSNRDFARSCEIEARGFDFDNSSEDDNFTLIFEKMRKICYGVPVKPALYFTHAKGLMDVFDAMETQQLHYYTHVHHLAPYTKILRNGMTSLKDIITQDSALVASSIKRFENLLQFSEQVCAQLEAKFVKILYGLFYKSVAASDVLKLTLHLEFCYEKVLLEKPLNMDITAIAKGLETFYMDFTKRLDSIKSDAVRRAMTKCMAIEQFKIRRANNAATELRLFYRLERELLRSHGISSDSHYRPIQRKSNKPKNNKESFNNSMKLQKKKSLTEAEVEYLTLFTDWTENDDPAIYLQSINLNDRNNDNSIDII